MLNDQLATKIAKKDIFDVLLIYCDDFFVYQASTGPQFVAKNQDQLKLHEMHSYSLRNKGLLFVIALSLFSCHFATLLKFLS
jgi:hypothetical protein